jgi:hydroxymethylpyrimidine/phosphomethylpyrimidine kinase
LKAERVATINTHGTGCTFSSAITAGLAKKMPMEDALQTAKDYVSGALKKGSLYQIGNGHGPVHHGFMI